MAMRTTIQPSPSVAPWAEVVPHVGSVTVDVLLALPDDGYVYEVVNGVLVRMAGGVFAASTSAGTLYFALRAFVQPRRLGAVTRADGVYKFPGAETGLLPDVGFLSAEKVALIEDRNKPVPFAPDLATEVASPEQTAEALAMKARTYLRGGTRLVWIVWPQRQCVDVWHPDQLDGPVATLGSGDMLDGEDVIPGCTYPLADLFADPLI